MFAKTNLKHKNCHFVNPPAVLAPHSNSASWPPQGARVCRADDCGGSCMRPGTKSHDRSPYPSEVRPHKRVPNPGSAPGAYAALHQGSPKNNKSKIYILFCLQLGRGLGSPPFFAPRATYGVRRPRGAGGLAALLPPSRLIWGAVVRRSEIPTYSNPFLSRFS